MASDTTYLSVGSPSSPDGNRTDGPSSGLRRRVETILRPLASLWITVVLFLMAIFIVYAGTTAQVEMDIWQVVHKYFRMDLTSPQAAISTAFCWIDARLLFPAAFFPRLSEAVPAGYGFWFPNGWLIGLGMFINLAAAHLIRFRIQSRGTRLIGGLVVVVAGCLATWGVIVLGSYQTADRPQLFIDHPSLRILWLLTQCTAASALLAVGCWLVFRKRSGIVLLHAGVGLLMFGELLVGVSAVESQMHILEGQTVNYAMDTREVELALIDSSAPQTDEVFAIPAQRLQTDDEITDEELPVDVEVLKFMPNSVLHDAKGGRTKTWPRKDVADEELPKKWPPLAVRITPVVPTQPAAYVRFLDKDSGKDLGTYLLSLTDWTQGFSEKLPVDGRAFTVQLRYKHDYKPYSMHLIDVEQETYMGTSKAKSYASELRLVDKDHQVDRKVRIWMNNPLRYGGATFYQSNYGMDPSGREYTGLQVVTNTGWRIPYMACMMVVVGMLVQFSFTLVRYMKRLFSGRLSDGRLRVPAGGMAGCRASQARPARPWTAFPLVELGRASCDCGPLRRLAHRQSARCPSAAPNEINFVAFGQLPVTFEGRVKPIDTLARSSLRKISDRQTYIDEEGNRQPAIHWFLDVITDSPARASTRSFASTIWKFWIRWA